MEKKQNKTNIGFKEALRIIAMTPKNSIVNKDLENKANTLDKKIQTAELPRKVKE